MATWTILAYCTWLLLFNRGKKIAFQSIDGDLADELIKKVKIIYDHLPWWKPKADFKYCHVTVPEMLSEGYGIKQGAEKLRSLTYSLIFSDEYGFQEKLEETFGAAKPTVDGGGKFIACTTPPRTKNFAYKCKSNPLFKVMEIHYTQRPDRNEAWKKKAKIGISEEDWNREYELEITQAGVSRVFSDFTERIHVNPNLVYVKDRILFRSWDFGFHRPCVAFAQIDQYDRFCVLDSVLGKDIHIDPFAVQILKHTNLVFPDAMVQDVCDFAGTQVNDKRDKTSIQILNGFGITPNYRFNKDKEEPANILRKKLIQLIGGAPGFQIHSRNRYLIDALTSIIFKKDGVKWNADGMNEEGLDEKGYYMHGIDVLLYFMLNIYTIMGTQQTRGQKASALKTKVGNNAQGFSIRRYKPR